MKTIIGNLLHDPNLLVYISILLAIGTCIKFLFVGNLPVSLYWFSAALINFSVIWISKSG